MNVLEQKANIEQYAKVKKARATIFEKLKKKTRKKTKS